MLSAHAPTEDQDEMKKEEFYNLLSKTCDQAPKYDMLIILDDFNAKIGKEHNIARTAGKYTIHNETSANGNLLTQFAHMNNLIIMSICFNHMVIHKGTWKPPRQLNATQISQIDHILVSSRHATSIIDVRT
jgi:endonuclease/exonuclease/phosphatase family metal-dependent hydrolase